MRSVLAGVAILALTQTAVALECEVIGSGPVAGTTVSPGSRVCVVHYRAEVPDVWPGPETVKFSWKLERRIVDPNTQQFSWETVYQTEEHTWDVEQGEELELSLSKTLTLSAWSDGSSRYHRYTAEIEFEGGGPSDTQLIGFNVKEP